MSPAALKQWVRRFACGAGILVFVGAAVVLVGWSRSMAALTSLSAASPQMAGITAVAFALAGLGLWAAAEQQRHMSSGSPAASFYLWWTRGPAGLIIAVGVARLSELLLGWPQGIGQLVFGQPLGTPNPAAMGLAPAASFICIGCALFLSDRTRAIGMFQGLCLLPCILGWVGLNRYVFGGQPLTTYAD